MLAATVATAFTSRESIGRGACGLLYIYMGETDPGEVDAGFARRAAGLWVAPCRRAVVVTAARSSAAWAMATDR